MFEYYLKHAFHIFPLLLISLAVGCGQSSYDVITLDVAGPKCRDSTQLKALFIGNSYTFVNNMPSLFKNMACDAGINVLVTMAAQSNYRFQDHANSSTTLNAIDSRQWDFVILQNHSLALSHTPADVATISLPHAVTLADAISLNNNLTQIIYYVTQGRENGDILNCPSYPLVCTFVGHTEALNTGYQVYQNSTGGQLALASNAWKMVVDDTSAPFAPSDLWKPDKNSHPELLGSYLSTCTLFATIFNQSPLGLAAPNNVSETNALYLQQISADTMGL